MNSLRAKLVVLGASHKALAQALINDKYDLGRDLGAQKVRLVKAHFLPFGEIFGDLGKFDARRRLAMARMMGLLRSCGGRGARREARRGRSSAGMRRRR